MAFHSHGDKPFEAQRVFTDRKEPVALFDQAFVDAQERDDHRIICWYGVGGQGKSRLHDEVRRRIADDPDVALAGLDFDVPRHRRLEDAMLKLRGDLAGCGMSFPTFDLAFARHFALERPGENIREVYPQLYRRGESRIVDDMLDWSEAGVDAAIEGISLAVPGLNLLYRYGSRLTGRLGEWWSSQAVKSKLAGLDDLAPSELAERLPQYLGLDIWRARADIGCPRVVITIDTHEKLGNGELRGDAWLQTLVRETPGALIAIFGRDKLRWAELDERWDAVLDQHLLGALSVEDADSFLVQVPIPEADIRARIVAASGGLPHYLDLAVSLYEDIHNSGVTPKPDNFGNTPADVRERFLDHLPPDERRELFLAAYPEGLSERLFLDLADAFLGGAGNVNWARLGRRSFMTEGADGRMVMHALMREALQEQDEAERCEFFARVHGWLFERYAARARVPDVLSVTPEAEQALLAACGHAVRLGPQHLLDWIVEAHEPFYDASRWRVLDDVHAGALGCFSEPSADRAWLLFSLARVRQALGRHAEADTLYEQVLVIEKAALGEAHPSYATTLHELARVRQAMGRHAEAEALYEQALAITKAALGEAHPSYATMLHNLALVRQAMGRNAEAEALYEQALAIEKAAHGEAHPSYVTTLHMLAHVRQAMGRNAEAEVIYEKSIELTKTALGEVHPNYARMLDNLAYVRQALGRNAEAGALYEQALAIKKTSLGENHPHYAVTLHALANLRQVVGHNAEAEALYKQVLTIREAALGEAHPDYAGTLHELARCRQTMGRHAEAEALYEQALEIFRTALGEAHPHAILSLASLAGCQACFGRVEAGREMLEIALARARSLPEGTILWTGRVRLRWAHGLLGAGLRSEAMGEARAARDLLAETLGPEAPLTREAASLIDDPPAED